MRAHVRGLNSFRVTTFFGRRLYVQARRGAAARAPAKTAGKFELTEEQKQEIREAFDLFDTDGSGA